jgi:hypothetical protein
MPPLLDLLHNSLPLESVYTNEIGPTIQYITQYLVLVIGRMLLSRNLSITLIDMPYKRSHYIVRLMPSVREYYLDSDDCALE